MNKIEIIPYTNLYEEQVFNLIIKIQNDEFGVPTIGDQLALANIPKHYQQNNNNFWITLDGDLGC
ncbi:hypothetical protein BH10PSE19_BH10PSE19_05520 [soil metagenome]